MDDDDEIIEDDELLDDDTPDDLAELSAAILAYREVDARYRVVYDEMMAARARVVKAHDAAGLGRGSGWSW